MTAHKHFKQLVRARMSKTGESYTTARRHVIRQAEISQHSGAARWHMPGNIPATTALRILLTAAGARHPASGEPLSEAMLFGLCGGIGAASTSFYYKQADFSSFFLAGRHLWNDDLAYLRAALGRFEFEPVVSETAGAKQAAAQLQEMLHEGRPCIAWVDMANLPHRGLPAEFSGGGYHVVTVYQVDSARGSALIGDLTDEPIEIELQQLAVARSRIKQFKNRLLSVPLANRSLDLSLQIRGGLRACHAGLKRSSSKGAGAMSGLEAIQKWQKQLGKKSGSESWIEMFPRGHRLWQGLTFAYDFIENYHTGGGLCRPLFAEFLAEAAEVRGWERLREIADPYADLGKAWSDLALAAIPQDTPAFQEARELCVRRAELRHSGGAGSSDEMRQVWRRLGELKEQARSEFPLSAVECAALLEVLHDKVAAICEAETSAYRELGAALQSIGDSRTRVC